MVLLEIVVLAPVQLDVRLSVLYKPIDHRLSSEVLHDDVEAQVLTSNLASRHVLEEL